MGMGWWMLLWGLVGLAVLVLLVLGVVWLVRALTSRPSSPPGEDAARRLLRERYAAGQLDRDEYLRKREDLR